MQVERVVETTKREEIHALGDGDALTVTWHGSPDSCRAVLVFLPAFGVAIRYYRALGEELARRGFAVAMIPMRERATVAETRRHDYGYHERLEVDLFATIPRVQQAARGKPLFLVGHSVGGQFALLHAGRRPQGIAGVALIAGGSNYYAALPGLRRVARRINVRLARTVDQMLGYFPGHKLGFAGLQPKKMMLDWTHEALSGSYRIAGEDHDRNRDLASLELPVFFISIAGDKLVPKSAAEFLGAKLKATVPTFVELSPATHFGGSVDHFRWAKKSTPVVEAMRWWMDGVIRNKELQA